MPYVQGPSISTRRASTLPAPRKLVPKARSDQRRRSLRNQRDPARRLQSGDDWRHWPARQRLVDLPGQSLEPDFRIPGVVNVTL